MPSLELRRNSSGSEKLAHFTVGGGDYDNQGYDDDTAPMEGGLAGELGHQTTNTYIKTLQRLTREVLPNINLYRDVRSIHMESRPTLEELHNETTKIAGRGGVNDLEDGKGQGSGAVKFGWITGVLIRCMLNIWGPIMFLRLTAIVGKAGIVQSILVILLSAVITSITGLSISAISTNGVVKGGGTYYLISRSLGPEFGGAIGIIFAFANAVAVAMHTVGFAESMRDLLRVSGVEIVDGELNDIRIIGVVAVCILLSITMIGMEWEQKTQAVLLVILVFAIFDVFIGSVLPAEDAKRAKGFEGWNADVISENIGPDYRGEGFFYAFAIFFPASTGILAGVNISGDLKDPSKAIPKGTLLAILITSICYIGFAVTAGATVWRDADGSIEHLLNGTYRDCAYNFTCSYGLQNNYQVMELIAGFGYLIYAGCFAATLSSALACLVSAPKIFQALCLDRIYKPLEWFGKGYGKNNEPLRSYILAFGIATAFILIAELNIIAPIISNFFMAAYCLINFACFHAALCKSPGFRPSFKYWNMWMSLVGAMLSSVVMFIMSWQTALFTFVLVLALYMYIAYKKPDVNWGSSNQAASFSNALKATQSLIQTEDHVKNYRPNVLILTGLPSSRPALLDFGNHVVKGIGLIVCGHVVKSHLTLMERSRLTDLAYDWFARRKIKAFYTLLEEESLNRGAKAMIQTVGVGKLKPNMLMMGFLSNWQNRQADEVLEYINTIHDAFDQNMSVGILHVEGGFDFSYFTNNDDDTLSLPFNKIGETINGHNASSLRGSSSDVNSSESSFSAIREDAPTPTESNESGVVSMTSPETVSKEKEKALFKRDKKTRDDETVVGGDRSSPVKELPKDVLNAIDIFRTGRPKQTIDVWWLYDDGGLTLLIPYILTTRKYWQKCQLRVFTVANKDHELDQEQLNLAALLRKFRINYTDVVVLPNVTQKPKESSQIEFDLILKNMKCKAGEDKMGIKVSEAELDTMRSKTERYIRIRELLLRQSRNAELIVMTLPIPKKNKVSPSLYLAWLEALTKDLPPVFFVRGNQTSVLTLYS